MFGALADGHTHVSGFLQGEDCLSTLRVVESLGARVERPAAGEVSVEGAGLHGLRALPPFSSAAMRLFMGLLSAQSFDSVLTGDESLMRRPMERAAKPRSGER